jgi:hypothetical protein
MRGLFRWAHRAQHIKHDPTAGVESPTRAKSEGFKPGLRKMWPPMRSIGPLVRGNGYGLMFCYTPG